MDAAFREKWQAIESFALDAPEAALSFSMRLARDQCWSQPYTERAILEYKRFVFLALYAGHPVTPSEVVDLVWHEHLTHTRNYWDRFCGEILGQPLHHEPSQGGPRERARYHAQYERTLEAYRRLFAQTPPADLWPRASVRFRRAAPAVRVKVDRYWLAPTASRRSVVSGMLGAVSLFLAGCSVLRHTWPWSLSGADFLRFYVPAMGAGIALALVLRSLLRRTQGAVRTLDAARTDVYLQAYVAGAEQRVVLAALARCVATQSVAVGGQHRRVEVRLINASIKGDHPVETALVEVLAQSGGSLSLADLITRLQPVLFPLADEARACGWLLTPAQRRHAWLWPLTVGCLPLALGLSRFAQGVSAGRPIGYLTILLVLGALVVALTLLRRPWLSQHGREQLNAWRREQNSLENLRCHLLGTSPEPTANPAQAVALFGVGALAGVSLYKEFTRTLGPVQQGGDGGFDHGGGDSGGSDSGGGCGSGCGGCGGGGGD